MRLRILTPTEVLFDGEVSKVTAEAEDGSFALLPRHIDFVSTLVPGLLFFETDVGQEEFVAVDEGVLVKCSSDVFVSTFNAVRGPDLGTLQHVVREEFQTTDERERRARSALLRLQADLMRRYIELGEQE